MTDRTNRSKTTPNRSSNVATARSGGRSSMVWWLAIGLVGVVGVAIVVAVVVNRSSPTKVPEGAAADQVVAKATSVPASVTNAVGLGTAKAKPTALTGSPLVSNGKPEVLYVGAEYCPYCATQRWAIAEALSRFGTFDNLGITHSATADVFPDTPTLTFHGSKYSSPYLTFTPVETQTNEPDGKGGYEPLDTLTPEQEAIAQKVNPGGSIPFLDIGGVFAMSGATYDPQVLQGHSAKAIANAMHDPSTDIAKGAVGSANLLTALICKATDAKPEKVCTAPAIKAITAKLG